VVLHIQLNELETNRDLVGGKPNRVLRALDHKGMIRQLLGARR
jgi:hypothetical protein